MNKVLLILVSYISSGLLFGQTTFNEVYDNESYVYPGVDRIAYVEMVDDTIYALGMANDSLARTIGAMWRIQPDGQLIDKFEYPSVIDEWQSNTIWDGMAARTEDGFVMVLMEFDGLPGNSFEDEDSLIHVSRTGEIIWKKSLYDDSVCCMNNIYRGVVGVSNGDLLSLGMRWDANDEPLSYSQIDGLLTRLTENGEVLWHQTYEDIFQIGDIIERDNGGFLVCGHQNLSNDGPGQATGFDPIIWRIDSLGNELWRYVYANETDDSVLDYDGMSYVETLADGSIFLVNVDYGPGFDDNYGAYMLTRLEDNGAEGFEVLEQFHVFAEPIYKEVRGVHTLANGNLAIYGFYGVIDSGFIRAPMGSLWVLDQELDSLYSRVYSYFDLWEFPIPHSHYFHDMNQIENGDLLLGGRVRVSFNDPIQPHRMYPWLVRTDSLGCLEPGCQNITDLQEQVIGLDGSLTLYPNPVRSGSPLRIAFTPKSTAEMPYAHQATRLLVHDLHGRQVHVERIPPTGSTAGFIMEVDVPHLSTGQYVLHWMNEEGVWYDGLQFVVE